MPAERAALWLGLILFALGVAVSLQGLIVLARNHTPVDPSRPDLTWSVIFLVPVVLIVHYKIIKPEEAYLQKKFPDTYPAYQRRVRRWL